MGTVRQHGSHYQLSTSGAFSWKNLTGVAVQFATEDQKKFYSSSRYIAIFNIKICYYVVLFLPISSKLDIFAMQNFESK